MKFWKSLPAFYTIAALVWAAVAYLIGPSWMGMFYAAVAGHFLGYALWTPSCNRWRALFESARDALQEMTDINDALIHNRVTLHFLGETPPICPPDEHKPSLH